MLASRRGMELGLQLNRAAVGLVGGRPALCLAGNVPWSSVEGGWSNQPAVTLPGSAIPLVRNVIVFLLQYGVAVASAMSLRSYCDFAIGKSTGPG